MYPPKYWLSLHSWQPLEDLQALLCTPCHFRTGTAGLSTHWHNLSLRSSGNISTEIAMAFWQHDRIERSSTCTKCEPNGNDHNDYNDDRDDDNYAHNDANDNDDDLYVYLDDDDNDDVHDGDDNDDDYDDHDHDDYAYVDDDDDDDDEKDDDNDNDDGADDGD
eukprot:7698556-Karenia_brevis.AAC.1